MATSSNTGPFNFELLDISEEDKAAAQKYLNENGIRGIEDFLAERLDAWRKWLVVFHYYCLSISTFLVH